VVIGVCVTTSHFIKTLVTQLMAENDKTETKDSVIKIIDKLKQPVFGIK
jgi:hypothetical protein